jgi:methylmalonyl-CoA/ethylmalonyl-CoA epimerase
MLDKMVCQVGIIVRDIEKTGKAYAEVFGLPVPTPIITDTVDAAHTEYKGESTEARAKLAFFNMGQVQIELIEPMGGPSTWQEFLDTKGEGVHHIAFQVKGMDDVISDLKSKGLTLEQKGDYTGGRYAYLNGSKDLKVILELLENF